LLSRRAAKTAHLSTVMYLHICVTLLLQLM